MRIRPTTLSRDEVRDLDRRAIDEIGIPSQVLMENAGRGATDVLLSLGVAGPVTILCGKGNNGGDGLVLARHLALRGVRATPILFAETDSLSPDTKVQWNIVQALQLPFFAISVENREKDFLRCIFDRSDWIVDGLFGTGLRGPVQSPFDRIIDLVNRSGARVFALDLPSGLDTDTGSPTGPTIRADHTVTFAAPKRGFAMESARAWLGKLHVADIGMPIFSDSGSD